jgi:hypothetical protein
MIRIQKTNNHQIEFLLFILISLFICSCQPFQRDLNLHGQNTATNEVTPFQSNPQATATIGPVKSTPVTPSLPVAYQDLKIDGIKATSEFEPQLKTWIWKDKKGNIRRLLDPFSEHLLVRTYIPEDRLAYEIDYAFKWEVNLVNYDIYPTHAPFGSAYVKLLKNKYPGILSQANDQTGIVFRILQAKSNDLPGNIPVITLLDVGMEKERFFLKPTYLSSTNEYVLAMGLSTDFLTRKGAINTYTEEMLNNCFNPEPSANPTGAWGIEVYKHTIK